MSTSNGGFIGVTLDPIFEKVTTFTSSGNFTPQVSTGTDEVEVLVVSGGGGGGSRFAGGGGGGVRGDGHPRGLHDRNDDRAAAYLRDRGPHRGTGGLLLLRHERPDPDDVRTVTR